MAEVEVTVPAPDERLRGQGEEVWINVKYKGPEPRLRYDQVRALAEQEVPGCTQFTKVLAMYSGGSVAPETAAPEADDGFYDEDWWVLQKAIDGPLYTAGGVYEA